MSEWVSTESYDALKRDHEDLMALFWTAVYSQPDHKLVLAFSHHSPSRMDLVRDDVFDGDAVLFTARLTT